MTQQDYKLQDKGKKSLVLGGIIVLLIAISPFLFYTYKSLPNNTQVWETFIFSTTTSYFSVNAFGWFLVGKIIPIYLLLLWFFTCKHWWHWIILVPITMYIFQLWGIINQSKEFDEVELIYLLPLMMVVIPAVYVIRAKLFAKIHSDDLKSFEEELGQKRTVWQQIKDLFR
ncbi:MAG: hypothetical protein QM499_07405 [Flavobacteriaceae bacterium]